MKIVLDQVGKRFGRDWVLRRLNYQFESGTAYALQGPNGSGKSTLIRLLCGHLTPSRGTVRFSDDAGREIPVSVIYRECTLAGPYIDLIEEFTLEEAIDFHFRFKTLQPELERSELPELFELAGARRRYLSEFSSGMRRRLQLGLAICSQSPILLLDEPTVTLDAAGVAWFLGLAERFRRNRLVVVASNVASDFAFCEQALDVRDFK
jgi:ABC-type multidrug transport system ATPase subunit